MKPIQDNRKIRISVIEIVNGSFVKTYAADAWQDARGNVILNGLWSGLVPLSNEDHRILSIDSEVSPLEMLRKKLLNNPFVNMEIVG